MSGFQLRGSLWQDEQHQDSSLVLFINRYESIERVEVPVVKGVFAYQDESGAPLTEITCVDQRQHTVYIYALPGADIELHLDSAGGVSWIETDSLNSWLGWQHAKVAGMKYQERVSYVDSLCRTHRDELRTALLLCDEMETLNDSIAVRRCLGSLQPEVKPAWLMKRFDEQFDLLSAQSSRVSRLPREVLPLLSDTVYGLLDTRQESLVLLFWADYDSASVDSLQLLRRIARDYGLYEFAEGFAKEKSPTRSEKAHKVELLSVCMHAADSAAWRRMVDSIPGKHTWLQGGFAHMLPIACQVKELPHLVQADRFGNVQSSNKWGKPLYEWLNRTPVNTAVAHTDGKSNPKKLTKK